MNTQLTASLNDPPHLSHPPDPLTLLAPASNRVARTSWLDRAAMRVGLWLVQWGSRHEADAAYATRLWMHHPTISPKDHS